MSKRKGKGRNSRPGIPHQQANGTWLQYVTIEGKRFKCSGPTKREVQSKVAALRAGVTHPSRRIAKEQGPTLHECCETALRGYEGADEAGTHHSYTAAYRKWQSILGADTRRNTITNDMVQDAIDALSETLAARTIRAYVAALHVALGKGHPALVQLELPRPDDKPKLLVPFDLATRLQAVAQHHPYGMLIGFGFGAGLRAGEACAIRWSDIDLERVEVAVNGAIKPSAEGGWRRGKTKTRKNRIITIHADLIAWLTLHRRIQADTAQRAGYPTPEYVAAHIETGASLPRHEATKVLRELLASVTTPAEWAIYGTLRYHDLRHTHLSNLLAAGVGLPDVAERAGHSLAELMSTYAHAIPGAGPRIAQIAGSLFPISTPQATIEATLPHDSATQRGQNLTLR
jgi:integrase